jgi:hypothetical protein
MTKRGIQEDFRNRTRNYACEYIIPVAWDIVVGYLNLDEVCYGCIYEALTKSAFSFPQTTVCKSARILWDVDFFQIRLKQEDPCTYNMKFIISNNKNERVRWFPMSCVDVFLMITTPREYQRSKVIYDNMCTELYKSFKKECGNDFGTVARIVRTCFELHADHLFEVRVCTCNN